jgi:hypothetical protein
MLLTQSMRSLATTSFGVSNGSAALALTRAFRANRKSSLESPHGVGRAFSDSDTDCIRAECGKLSELSPCPRRESNPHLRFRKPRVSPRSTLTFC